MILFWICFAVRTLLRRGMRTAITLAAIALGVGALTFLGSMMVGVNDAMVSNSISLWTGNLLVRADDPSALIDHWRDRKNLPPQISVVLPRLIVPAILATTKGSAPVRLVGVLPGRERSVSAISHRLEKGHYLPDSSARAEILVGSRVAEALGVSPGDSLKIQPIRGQSHDLGVCGIFRTGLDQFDEGVAHVHLETLKALNLGTFKGEVALFLLKGISSQAGEALIAPLLSRGETVAPWEEILPELDQLLRLNLVSMSIVIILVVVMMAAGVSNTILVTVMDRYRAFGVLKALGVTPGEIVRLILIETALMCLVAGSTGLCLGSIATLIFGQMGIDLGRWTSENPHFLLSGIIYPRLTWEMAMIPAMAVLSVGTVSSLWPAAIAARRRARDVMRLSP